MKRFFLLMTMLVFFIVGFSQRRVTISEKKEEEKDHSFKQENIFLGGSISLGLGSGYFAVGGNPEVGYTLTKWLDVGIGTNINYYTISPEYNNNRRDKSFSYGGGVFARLYPINQLFFQIQPEYNWTKISAQYVGYDFVDKLKLEAPSLLMGIGYTTREIGNSSFYTVIMMDFGNNIESPYIGYLGSKEPILRAGFNFYLGPKKK